MPLPTTQSPTPSSMVMARQESEGQSLAPVVQREEPTQEAEETYPDAEPDVFYEDGEDSDSDSCALSFWGSDDYNAQDTPCTSECTSDTSSMGDDDSSDSDDSSDEDDSSEDDSSDADDSSDDDENDDDEEDAMDLDENMELGEADMDISDGTSISDVMEIEPREENPLIQAAGSGQAVNASATTPSAAQLQQSYHYPPQATNRPQFAPSTWGCRIHGTQTPRCLICDIEFWRVQCLIRGQDFGRIPPPPLPIYPTPLHQPGPSSIAHTRFATSNAANSHIGFQGMPPNFPGGFGFGQQGGGGGGGGGNSGDWGNPHGAKRPRPE
ncbi:hypothetical protein M441DRAFT_309405 [Trichoderma asperellum CBS 433.97]|uniref:Uncharacterized protein n=1 Tax=Trichoderma asperellum (strain ATCC 204424 / CBS 433.97 / NBRC 101777) TaxID=1042311 RepID=A0A2T3ZK76_TRIA4|nr:hypothetical protein M441DRAFT_309405 [Trichoderma asperellum CBS 433.97]PTB45182.1 hypothetical protein M441DRAFT_309405 [Trichoderma asperellum CBS 433.97]